MEIQHRTVCYRICESLTQSVYKVQSTRALWENVISLYPLVLFVGSIPTVGKLFYDTISKA